MWWGEVGSGIIVLGLNPGCITYSQFTSWILSVLTSKMEMLNPTYISLSSAYIHVRVHTHIHTHTDAHFSFPEGGLILSPF